MIFGEAIYDFHPWRVSGEGSTRTRQGQFTDGSPYEFTSEDIRYTVNKDFIYAIVLNYPNSSGQMKLRSFGVKGKSEAAIFEGFIKNICILGCKEISHLTQTDDALVIETPDFTTEFPAVIKIQVV